MSGEAATRMMGPDWEYLTTPDGLGYFYNMETDETVWDKSGGAVPAHSPLGSPGSVANDDADGSGSQVVGISVGHGGPMSQTDRELQGDDDSNFTERSRMSFSMAGALDTDRSREENVVRALAPTDANHPVVKHYHERREREQQQEQQQQQQQQQSGAGMPHPDWTVVTDDNGRTYYWNQVTDQTAWELPQGLRVVGNDVFVEEPEDVKATLLKRYARPDAGITDVSVGAAHAPRLASTEAEDCALHSASQRRRKAGRAS
jgi:hypothetical protein